MFSAFAKKAEENEVKSWNPLTNFILENNDNSFKDAISKFNKFNNKEPVKEFPKDNSESGVSLSRKKNKKMRSKIMKAAKNKNIHANKSEKNY